jgi:tetratricopeptide (TPR) repeat protein
MHTIENHDCIEIRELDRAGKQHSWPALVLLGLLVMVPYLQVMNHAFINWDDPHYIFTNRVVTSGLTWTGVSWAFTTNYAANWHPLTWMSHLLDSTLFGASPRGVHLVNVAWHTLNSLLVCVLFRRLGVSIPASFFMAAFFGLHPLHVESVAWAAERKDLLCAFFFLGSTLAYLQYVSKPSITSYLAVSGLFILALLSKPMAVTWPCIALLLDFWPTGRWKKSGSVFYEKIPWLLLSIAAAIVTLMVQKKGHAVKSLEIFPLSTRVANAGVSYLEYIRQSFWPVGLTVYYPQHQTINWVQSWASWLGFGALTVAALRQADKRPYLLWGWTFYVIALLPVIGVIQVGNQAHADRYTYLPQIGLILALGLLLDRTVVHATGRRVLAAVTCLILITFSVLTSNQVGYWQSSQRLFTQNLEVAGENFLAHYNLATAYSVTKQFSAAIFHFERAMKLNPRDPDTYINLGNLYQGLGIYREAETAYLEAIRRDPSKAVTYLNLGSCYVKMQQFAKAEVNYLNAMEIDSSLVQAYYCLADLKDFQGLYAESAALRARGIQLERKGNMP